MTGNRRCEVCLPMTMLRPSTRYGVRPMQERNKAIADGGLSKGNDSPPVTPAPGSPLNSPLNSQLNSPLKH